MLIEVRQATTLPPPLGHVQIDTPLLVLELVALGVALLGVEDLVVALEQPGDGGLVNLHLGVAHADSPVADQAVAFLADLKKCGRYQTDLY